MYIRRKQVPDSGNTPSQHHPPTNQSRQTSHSTRYLIQWTPGYYPEGGLFQTPSLLQDGLIVGRLPRLKPDSDEPYSNDFSMDVWIPYYLVPTIYHFRS